MDAQQERWIADLVVNGTLSPGALSMDDPFEAAQQYNSSNALEPGDPGYLVPPSSDNVRRGIEIVERKIVYPDRPTRAHHLEPTLRAALHEAMQNDLVDIDEHGHPIISNFLDKFVGVYDSFRDYAIEYAESVGLLDGVSEEVKRYFSWHGYSRDLAIGHTICGAPDYRVFIFRDY